jgi:hypothetical protein
MLFIAVRGETERLRERETDRQTDRRRERGGRRERERERERREHLAHQDSSPKLGVASGLMH